MRFAVTTLMLAVAVPLAAQERAPVAPGSTDPRFAQIVSEASAERLQTTLRTLVGFGTRHTLSDTVSRTRGIGAARRWIHAEFTRISAACGNCLEVQYVGETWGGLARVAEPANVVSVIAILRGTTDPNRVVLMSGHFDSRNSGTNNITDDAPGANDDGSGTVAVIEAARLLSRRGPFNATLVFAALAGEEQSLLGGQTVARYARSRGWRVQNLNNDIVGNTRGGDGVVDTMMLRVFSDAVPPNETEAQRNQRRGAGGEVDGISRQLARYAQMIGRRHVPGLDVWLIYRHDRFGRGGDHRAFADEGFAAVRFTEGHEDFTKQHQTLRTEGGISYGDVLEGVDFNYLRKVTALNAATMAALAWAPGAPRQARLSGGGRYAAELEWQPPVDSANVTGYRIYWRRTDSPTWDHYEDIGNVRRYTATGRIVDNWYFGVAALGANGHESVVTWPTPPVPQGGN